MPRVRIMRIVASGMQKNGQEVTPDMLRSVVSNFSSDSRPPVTPGHPGKGDDQVPALGRVDNLRTEPSRDFPGETDLVGEAVYTPELEALEDTGKFEGFSAGIFPHPDSNKGWYMHHLATLGQNPPAADTKTYDVVKLSDANGFDKAIYLSAHLGASSQKKDIDMTEDELKKAVKGLLAEALKPLSERLAKLEGSKEGEPEGDDPSKTGKTGDDKTKPGGEGGENTEITAMQEMMAQDRRDTLTELADGRDMTEAQLKAVTATIKGAATIELCAAGDKGVFATTKALIKSFPEKGKGQAKASGEDDEWGDLTTSLELSDDKSKKASGEIFDMSDW